MKPKDRLQQIAKRLESVFLASTREDGIGAVRAWDRSSLQDAAWLLHRERGLRSRLQQTLKRNAELEMRVRVLEGEGEKLGLRSPVVRRSSSVENEEMASELRQLSKDVRLESALHDAFAVDESEWFEETAD